MCGFFRRIFRSKHQQSEKQQYQSIPSERDIKAEYLEKAREYLDQKTLNPKEDGPLHCPLSLDLYEDPVIDPHGFVFERFDILQWLEYKNIHPFLTTQSLAEETLTDFPELLELVNEFKASYPSCSL